MKTPLLALLILAAGLSAASAQTAKDSAIRDVPLLLTTGRHLAQRLAISPAPLSSNQQAIQAKAVKGAMDHAAWFRDSLLSYHDSTEMMNAMREKLGLTPEEFKQYMAMAANPAANATITIAGQDTIVISAHDNRLWIKGYGSFAVLDSLSFDAAANTVWYKGFPLDFKRRNILKEDNPLHSAGIGYEYQYDAPVEDIASITKHMERYSLTVIRLAPSGKAMLVFMGMKMSEGRTVLARNLMLRLD